MGVIGWYIWGEVCDDLVVVVDQEFFEVLQYGWCWIDYQIWVFGYGILQFFVYWVFVCGSWLGGGELLVQWVDVIIGDVDFGKQWEVDVVFQLVELLDF